MSSSFLARTGTLPLSSCINSICVLQGEACLVSLASSSIRYLGSQDATTCAVVVLLSATLAMVVHLDDTRGFPRIFRAFLGEPVRAYVVGGGSVGAAAAAFLSGECEITWELCCVGTENTDKNTGFPKSRALVVDLLTGIPMAMTFEDRGPEVSRRMARMSFDGGDGVKFLEVGQNGSECEMVLEGFECVLDKRTLEFYKKMRQRAKEDPRAFLKVYSTSPLHESEWFVSDMIAKFDFLIETQGRVVLEKRFNVTLTGWVEKNKGVLNNLV